MNKLYETLLQAVLVRDCHGMVDTSATIIHQLRQPYTKHAEVVRDCMNIALFSLENPHLSPFCDKLFHHVEGKLRDILYG